MIFCLFLQKSSITSIKPSIFLLVCLKNIYSRVIGSLLGACLFFIVTNFGIWSLGSYGYSLEGLMMSYTLAIPFFTYTIISTFIFSGIIEGVYKLTSKYLKLNFLTNSK